MTTANVLGIVQAKISERTTAAAQLQSLGRNKDADRLQAEAAVLMSYVD